MNRLLLFLENKMNRALLADWLGQRYEVILPDPDITLATSFDICLLDGPTLDRHWQEIQARKAEDEPTFLPFILITSQRETDLITRHLWKTVDELIRTPIEKLDLQARVEVLLRARRLSLELRLRNQDLQSFFHAMTHDLRAPLRAIKGFSHLLRQDNATRLSPQGDQDLTRIQQATEQMQELLEGLFSFARIEYKEKQLQPVQLGEVIERCLIQQASEIAQKQARITKDESFPEVQGNQTLLVVAISNLISNALKFIAPGITPAIAISARTQNGLCRLEVADNGIGIALSDQDRLFSPFVQLHGTEVYDGIGLGLATVRKIMEMLGGRIGVTSQPGLGSIFWIELCPAEKEYHAISVD